jgi:hypothetical protein
MTLNDFEIYFTKDSLHNSECYSVHLKWNENEKPIVPWRAKASSFEGQLNVYACDELFHMPVALQYIKYNVF